MVVTDASRIAPARESIRPFPCPGDNAVHDWPEGWFIICDHDFACCGELDCSLGDGAVIYCSGRSGELFCEEHAPEEAHDCVGWPVPNLSTTALQKGNQNENM